MAKKDLKNTMGAEFQSLPLDFLISAPLVAAVKAQHVAAQTTKGFIESMIDNGKPITVDFSVNQELGGKSQSMTVNAPLLALVPVPHLRIDSLTTKFTFEIKQTLTDKSESEKGVEMEVGTSGALSPWVSASVKGSASSKSSSEATTNRSGQLEVTVQASESEIPEGLARVLSLMASAIQPPADSGGGGGGGAA